MIFPLFFLDAKGIIMGNNSSEESKFNFFQKRIIKKIDSSSIAKYEKYEAKLNHIHDVQRKKIDNEILRFARIRLELYELHDQFLASEGNKFVSRIQQKLPRPEDESIEEFSDEDFSEDLPEDLLRRAEEILNEE